ncbi:MAG: SUMF1/EgtB/PvdO family nonheme iron enzyme [Chloroflexi bacterium]|nr:SUMF1/EgtB/PvdO family nonheme iron enzyme [Chloroflexota bacterium]
MPPGWWMKSAVCWAVGSKFRKTHLRDGLRGTGSHDHRVLRGGSFNNNQRNARAAVRNRNNPNNRNRNNGFRVVVVHVSQWWVSRPGPCSRPEMRCALRGSPPRQPLPTQRSLVPGLPGFHRRGE